MNTKDLKKLRERLPHRYTAELSRRTGAKPDLIRQVMIGRKKDYHGIIRAAAEWIREMREEERQVRDMLKNNGNQSNH